MLADELDYVVGVDTHRDRHAVAVVDAHTGPAPLGATTHGRSATVEGGYDECRWLQSTSTGSRSAPAATQCA